MHMASYIAKGQWVINACTHNLTKFNIKHDEEVSTIAKGKSPLSALHVATEYDDAYGLSHQEI